MKKILVAMLLLFVFPLYAADTEVQNLVDITSPASSDDMYIVDDPDVTPASKKINIGALLGVATDLETGGALSANTVDSSELVDGSVDLSHMSSSSVDSDNIVNDTIANIDMADNSVDSAEYVDNSIDDDHINFGTGANQVAATDIPMAVISGSTFSTVQDLQNIFHSAGWVSGGGVTDDGDGTITVATGTGLIRATDSATAEILFMDWAAESGANVNLADNDVSWGYVEYNAGSPRVIATTTERTDFNTNVLLFVIQRAGTTLHINVTDKHVVGDHANGMIRRLKGVQPYGHVSGGILSETGTRNIALTVGTFWRGLTEFATSAVDTSGAPTFTYYYNDGAWQSVTTSDIHQTNYNNFGVGLATLSNNKYGVHWVYLEADDDDISVIYGIGDYTLSQAEDAQPPSAIPEHLQIEGILAGKIIIKKSDAAFTQLESAFQTTFAGSLASDHGGLAGLSDDDHAQYLLADGSRALSGPWDMDNQALTNINIDSGRITGIIDLATADGGTGQSNLTNLITLTTHTTGNYAAGDAEAGAALTGDAAVDFFDAGVDAVTDTTTCTDIEGRSLTIGGGVLGIDNEAFVYTAKIAFENPTTGDDFFFDELLAADVTFTQIYGKTASGTIDFDLTIAGVGINGSAITITTSGVLDASLGGDTSGSIGEEVKLEISATTGSPTYFMIKMIGTYND